MGNIEERISNIEEKVVGSTKKRILLVEGVDDKQAFMANNFSAKKSAVTCRAF